MVQLNEASKASDFEQGRILFREYAEGLGIDLAYQNFERELLDIERMY